MKRVYLGSKLLFKQVLLNMMEHCLLFLIAIFQVFLLFFLSRDPGGLRIGYTTTTLSYRLTYHVSENNTIKQHLIIKHNNSIYQLTSSDVRKILTDNTIIIYKNNNKKRLQILKAISIKILKNK